MMFSASYYFGLAEGDALYYIKKQISISGIGLIAMFILSAIDYHILRRIKIVFV